MNFCTKDFCKYYLNFKIIGRPDKVKVSSPGAKLLWMAKFGFCLLRLFFQHIEESGDLL